MRIAAIQHDIVWEDPTATCAHVLPMIESAAESGARLIVLTEMFATGFSMAPERIAEDEGGPIEQFLIDTAGRLDVHLIASISQRGPDGLYRNNAIVASPDVAVWRYAKIHPFTYSGEDEHYAAGDQFLTVEIEGLRVSVFVCYDLRFADEFWALAENTDLYVVPANWPAERREHWRVLLRARAVENQAYVVGVNRVGARKTLQYVGDSAVIDPLGQVLAEASVCETVLSADVDAQVVQQVREKLPFLPDRRVPSGR